MAQHTVAPVTVIHAPTSVLSRIATIQAHLRLSTADTDASMTPATVAGFDPFGAASQAALDQAPVGGSNDPPAESIAPLMDSGGARAVRTAGAVRTRAHSPSSSDPLCGEDVAQMAYRAGFRGDDLVNVVAISTRESDWSPDAFNGNADTGDRSDGLMQINMIGDLGPTRLREFGTNLNAAFLIYADSVGSLDA